MSRAGLRRRIAALSDALDPAGSVSARARRLTSEQRAIYREWQFACKRWVARHELTEGGAYKALIAGTTPPELPSDVRHTLFGPEISIPIDASVSFAMEAYLQFVFGGSK